jgi:hypothetical protein
MKATIRCPSKQAKLSSRVAPADISLHQPTKLLSIGNLKAERRLEHRYCPHFIAQADKAIESGRPCRFIAQRHLALAIS